MLGANAVPFGLSGLEDEIGFERSLDGLIGVAPAGEEEEPIFLKFAGKDESLSAATMFDGVLRGDGFAFRRGGPVRPDLRFSSGSVPARFARFSVSVSDSM